jgi:hypothetical protein
VFAASISCSQNFVFTWWQTLIRQEERFRSVGGRKAGQDGLEQQQGQQEPTKNWVGIELPKN